MPIDEFMEQFDVTHEQVTPVLDFTARSLETPTHGQSLSSSTPPKRGRRPNPQNPRHLQVTIDIAYLYDITGLLNQSSIYVPNQQCLPATRSF